MTVTPLLNLIHNVFNFKLPVSKLENHVILCFTSTEDEEGAFRDEFKADMSDFERRMSVIRYNISSVREINEHASNLKLKGRKISALIIRAHGSQELMILGPKNPSQIYAITPIAKIFLKETFDNLEPDAPIILESCSTGKLDENGRCIAKSIANYAKRTVFAPNEDAEAISVRYTLKKDKLTASFYNRKKTNFSGFFGSLLNAFYEIMYVVFRVDYLSKNISSEFKPEHSS